MAGTVLFFELQIPFNGARTQEQEITLLTAPRECTKEREREQERTRQHDYHLEQHLLIPVA